MSVLDRLYRSSLSLLTDLYQLTMAYGYWKTGMQDREAVFQLFFRRPPFQGGFTIACGLSYVCEYLERFRFTDDDIAYLGTLEGNDGNRLFSDDFLRFLLNLRLKCSVHGIPEGTVVFPHEPLVRVQGPLLHCQLLETPLLNILNFQTLIATKAARVCLAAQGEPVLEFGLRRAQGIDGGVTASRAAFIGGCAATSNVLAGQLFGIPVRGTHAHSWVMCFDTELDSFVAYAEAMPNNCIFLVDTYDTLDGVRRAVRVGQQLRAEGHEMVGIRLDSGDLAELSIKARKILDEGGFPKAVIVASNSLDENVITSLKDQHAKIGVWGVGTRLATAYDQPALGGVYKLSAIRSDRGDWNYKLKLSEQAAKINNPGILQVRRYSRNQEFTADLIYDLELGVPEGPTLIDQDDPTKRKRLEPKVGFEELLVPAFAGGRRVLPPEPIEETRARTAAQLARLNPGVRRFLNPAYYPVGLELQLHELKTQLILSARSSIGDNSS